MLIIISGNIKEGVPVDKRKEIQIAFENLRDAIVDGAVVECRNVTERNKDWLGLVVKVLDMEEEER